MVLYTHQNKGKETAYNVVSVCYVISLEQLFRKFATLLEKRNRSRKRRERRTAHFPVRYRALSLSSLTVCETGWTWDDLLSNFKMV